MVSGIFGFRAGTAAGGVRRAGSHERNRSAQFVRGVSRKLRDLLQREVDALKHGVQGFSQTLEFVAGIGDSKAGGKVCATDLLRRPGDLIDGEPRRVC